MPLEKSQLSWLLLTTLRSFLGSEPASCLSGLCRMQFRMERGVSLPEAKSSLLSTNR